MELTNIGLLENTIKCYNHSNYYIYGTYGQKLTSSLVEAKIRQYPNFYRNATRINNARRAVGKYTYAYDCVGLIKCYLFGGFNNVKYISKYDLSANGMYNKCTDKGKIKDIPKIKGLLVWMDGHIGIYDGEKYTYECTVSGCTFRIIKTNAKTRGWTNYGKCPYITYKSSTQKTVSIVDLAYEVIAGKYGTGEARKKALGSLYEDVQAKVNEILKKKKSSTEIAKEVLAGKWGNGDARKKKLEAAGYNYKEIQTIVNKLSK